MAMASKAASQKPRSKPPRKQPKKLQTPSQVLKNSARETFAQLVASGMKVAEAYREAGYAGGNRPRWELRNAVEVDARINFLVGERIKAQAKAAARPEKKLADARERLIRELERIAYSDVRQVASWDARPQFDADGNLIGIEESVRAVPSDRLSRDAAAAVKGVLVKAGRVQVDTHDKLQAIEKLAKILGMFKDDPPSAAAAITVNQVNVAGNALEAARRVGFLLGAIAAGQADAPPLELKLGLAGEDIAAGPSAPAANG